MVACTGSNRPAFKYEKSMIRNIIFDLGNVLLSWKPEEFLHQNGWDHDSRKMMMDEIFRSREWLLIDNGDLTLNEAAERIASRTSLRIPEILAVFDLRTRILFPLSQNTKLLPGLKKHGYRLYYLSNFPGDIFDEIQNKYELFSYFDGGIISARVRLSKPDPEIFRFMLNLYSLNPEECIFIDDIAANSNSAESVGISGVHLHDPDSLHDILNKKLGVDLLA
jgi:putative hydrolase of the HAD superfamily